MLQAHSATQMLPGLGLALAAFCLFQLMPDPHFRLLVTPQEVQSVEGVVLDQSQLAVKFAYEVNRRRYRGMGLVAEGQHFQTGDAVPLLVLADQPGEAKLKAADGWTKGWLGLLAMGLFAFASRFFAKREET